MKPVNVTDFEGLGGTGGTASSSPPLTPKAGSNVTGRRARSQATKSDTLTSTAYLDAVSNLFFNDEVFRCAYSHKLHVAKLLNERVANDEKPSDQLLFFAKTYVRTYKKRMEILQKKGGERTDTREYSQHWAVRIRRFLENPFAGKLSFCFYIILSLLVLASCCIVILQTIPAFNPTIFPELFPMWNAISISVTLFFLAEITMRFCATVFDPNAKSRSDASLGFFANVSNCLDLAASVIPIIGVALQDEGGFIGVFRLLRVFRIFTALRHFEVFEDLEETLRRSMASLAGPLLGLIVSLVMFASLIYTFEVGSWREATERFMVRNEDCELTAAFEHGLIDCHRSESKFVSVFHTMWFVLIMFVTVGYGYMVPLTMGGRAVSGLAIICGNLFMALPIAIVGTNFTVVVDKLKFERKSVFRYLERRDHIDGAFRERVTSSVSRKGSLPVIALFRFLRLTCEMETIEYDNLTKKMIYFANVFIQRVARQFLHPQNQNAINIILARSKVRRRPFGAKLRLIHPGCAPKTLSIVRPAVSSIGTSTACNIQLHSAMVRARVLLLRQQQPSGLSTLSVAAKKRETESLNQAAKKYILDQYCALGSHHADALIVNYGGTVDKLFVEPVAPFVVSVDSTVHDHRVQLNAGTTVTYSPVDSSDAALHTKFTLGVKFVAVDSGVNGPHQHGLVTSNSFGSNMTTPQQNPEQDPRSAGGDGGGGLRRKSSLGSQQFDGQRRQSSGTFNMENDDVFGNSTSSQGLLVAPSAQYLSTKRESFGGSSGGVLDL